MSWYCSNPQTENEVWDMEHPDPREMATSNDYGEDEDEEDQE